jgi:hypothetical protein
VLRLSQDPALLAFCKSHESGKFHYSLGDGIKISDFSPKGFPEMGDIVHRSIGNPLDIGMRVFIIPQGFKHENPYPGGSFQMVYSRAMVFSLFQ